jgi:hypothetical protein
MVKELQQDASAFGVMVQRLIIIEARYSPEIAPQMLMKQQASAMVAARREVVAGAINIIHDSLTAFPSLSATTQERMINNLLITLTSHMSATPVIPLSA